MRLEGRVIEDYARVQDGPSSTVDCRGEAESPCAYRAVLRKPAQHEAVEGSRPRVRSRGLTPGPPTRTSYGGGHASGSDPTRPARRQRTRKDAIVALSNRAPLSQSLLGASFERNRHHAVAPAAMARPAPSCSAPARRRCRKRAGPVRPLSQSVLPTQPPRTLEQQTQSVDFRRCQSQSAGIVSGVLRFVTRFNGLSRRERAVKGTAR